MADSKNSRTMPSVTRRNFLLAVAASLSLPVGPPFVAALKDTTGEDPALTLWQEWFAAHERLVDACRQQQRLETKLFSLVGSPPIASPEAWEMADKEVGYSDAKEAQEEASDLYEELAEMLWDIPAQSIAGATSKLYAMLKMGETSDSCAEFPWPQIRFVITDLLRIDTHAQTF